MKLMLTLIDKVRPVFAEEGKLSRFHPLFEAMDSFLFATPGKSPNIPYGRDPMDVKRYMSFVILALVPSLIASVYFFGLRILPMFVVSYVAGGAAEVLFSVIRKDEVNEGFLVTGFIFPLILPPGVPLWIVAVGVVFGVVVGKEIFGGTGRNLFNPALVGRIFLALGYPSIMAASWIPPAQRGSGNIFKYLTSGGSDALSSATPLVAAKGGEYADWLDLFLGRVLGSAGETSVIAIVVGGIFLLAVGVASWRTVFSILVAFVGLTAILRAVAPDSVSPVLFNLLSGGFLFGTFFMATDPVSSPVTRSGKWAYGIIIGAATVLIRSFSGFVEGMMFAVLFGNICAPLIDEVIIRNRIRRLARAS